MQFISEEIRKQFPILSIKNRGKKLVYLDNASTTQKPKVVIDIEKKYYEMTNANIHRATYELAERSTDTYIKAHEVVAKFIGAESVEEVIFTKNATEAVNLVAFSLSDEVFRGKKKILVSAMEHHSNLLPWQRLAREKKLELEFIELNNNFEINFDDLRSKINGSAIVAITHVSNVLGTINPIREIASIAHKNGALVLVDAAQSISHLPVDVKEMGADFLVFSGHKMYGPMGIGVLYGSKKILEKMRPFLVGGDMVLEVTRKDARWNDLPWKFEAGTPNVAGAEGLSAAIKFIESVGRKKIELHEKRLTEKLIKGLSLIEDINIIGKKNLESRTGVVSFAVNNLHSHDVATLLDHEGVAVRSGTHCAQPLLNGLGLNECLRVSIGITTTKKEIEIFIRALKKVIIILKK